MAPESFFDSTWDVKSDVWMFGVLLWGACTRRLPHLQRMAEIFSWAALPWSGVGELDVMQRHRSREKLPCPSDCPPAIYAAMLECWRLDVHTRASAAQVQHAIDDHITSLGVDASELVWPVMDSAAAEGVRVRGEVLDLASSTAAAAFHRLAVTADRVQLGSQLGKGQFGTVHRAVMLDGDGTRIDAAVKQMHAPVPDMELRQFVYEAKLLAALQHPHIVAVLGVCVDRQPHFIVLELMAGGDLKSFLKARAAELAAQTELLLGACVQIASAMAFLEQCKVVHRDLAARCGTDHRIASSRAAGTCWSQQPAWTR